MYPKPMCGQRMEPGAERASLNLFSTSAGERYVPLKSGVNQWNAGGRVRQFGECYIPISAEFRKNHPGFLPGRDEIVFLELPSGRVVKAKVCQQGGKALMTSPNNELSDWLLPLIDGSIEKSIRRYVAKVPYSFQDLSSSGIIAISLMSQPGTGQYKVSACDGTCS